MSSTFLCHANDFENSDTLQPKKPKVIIGASLTYIWGAENFNNQNIVTYNEWTWQFTAAVPIRRFRVGLKTYLTRSKYFLSEKNNFQFYGGFTQYNFTSRKKGRFYGEINYLKGNMCSCANSAISYDDYYKQPGLNYLGYGIGFENKLYKNFYYDIAFLNHIILNKIVGKFNFTLYVLALKYQF